ncbi:DinB family protein [Paenibacillus qinlingensis]|uniref:DinB family protein n=1 Tax=Paenibacillus qinlingensis TaxID=1837343 RepID=UPI001566CD05|nr:DinB family protein [Paenibacillus qinlingensis]NQX58016.1 DinB family protein [Paenibacillus qinlingensis]
MAVIEVRNYGKIIEELARFKELDEPRFLEPISEGKWSAKEIIGHLFYWDKFILEKHFPSMNQGAVLISFPDHDEHNSEAIQYISAYQTTGSLIEDFVEKRRLLIEMMSGIESDVIFTIGSENHQFTVATYLNIFIDHDNHHLNQIKVRLS